MKFTVELLNTLLPTANGIANAEAAVTLINGFEAEKTNMEAFIEFFQNQSELVKATLIGAYTSSNVLYHIAKPHVSFVDSLSYKELSRKHWGVLCDLLKPSISSRVYDLLLEFTFYEVVGRELADFEPETIEKVLKSLIRHSELSKSLTAALNAENVTVESSSIELMKPTSEQLFEVINICLGVGDTIFNKTEFAINKATEQSKNELAANESKIAELLHTTGTLSVNTLAITSFKNGKVKIGKVANKDIFIPNIEKMGFVNKK